MKDLALVSLTVFFLIGCQDYSNNIPDSELLEKVVEIEEKQMDLNIIAIPEKNIVIEGKVEFKNINIKEKVSLEVTADIKDSKKKIAAAVESLVYEKNTEKEKLITEGKWFFSACNFKEKLTTYYDKNRNFLGSR